MKPAMEAVGSISRRKEKFLFRQILDRRELLGPLMLAPAIVYIFLLIGFPFFLALYYSFSNVTTGSSSLTFVGLENFRGILQSATFRRALRNTFVFTFASQILVMILAKILALALNKQFRGKSIVRFLILLPWVSPISLGTIGWKWMYDSLYSVINWTLQAVGIFGPGTWPMWLGEPTLAMTAVVLVHVWRTLPFATVIILAGLTAIPQEILDAASVDGAGLWRRTFQVVLPLLIPILCVAVLFGVVFTFTDMTVIYVLTRGGPYDTTQVLGSYAFQMGILGGDLGEGAAISLFLFPLLAIVAILMLRIARRAEVE
ncbi:MAG: sugar ABC transporter permease [Nitrospinota bacterium]|nr:MAG: sugar ABC transporter permease [Nitrospinota bacterium]